MKKILLFIAITIFSLSIAYAQVKPTDVHNKALNSRSDTIDILNYQINLDITDFTNKIIAGNCKITFTPKLNGINLLYLDLLELNVDSVKDAANNLLTFSHNDTLLTINLLTLMNVGDTSEIIVFYNGTPQTDNSGFGGFYFDNTYAYNLGVGFNADPHNYGRVWFPCFDNFVEHATYEFNIITSGGKKAHCNGVLVSDSVINGDTIVRKWIMNEPIPTYLVCVAISDYATVHQNFLSTNGSIPVELVARAPDTTNLKNSFVNLNQALAIYENQYGPYLWSKIGFVLVPFNGGAMEHATCVAYPRVAANGSLAYETLMAHEFAHHWWGDLVTCETAGDMWINEGFATYSEHIFTEFLYGRDAYMTDVKANHKQVLQFAHIDDDGFRSLSNMDHAYTYGTHSYLKGASVAHNMRAYLGDSLFFYGVQQLMDSFKFKNINPTEFKDFLTTFTGVNMTDFFNDWVLSPGFSNFKVDSFDVVLNSPNYDVTLHVQQKLRGATIFHTGTPLEVTFYDNNWNKFTTDIVASGQYSTALVSVPFQPTVVILNEANLLNQARTDNQLKVKNTFNPQLQNLTLVRVGVNAVSDSALLHIEHHWVAPDSVKNNVNNYKISSSRYWRFTGILPTGFSASARIDFDGRASSGFLDIDLLSVNHDSLVLLYREDAHDDWQEFPYYSKTVIPGVPYGYVVIDSLLLGEYAFANSPSAVAIDEIKNKEVAVIEIFPNPTNDVFWLKTLVPYNQLQVVVYDVLGSVVHEEIFNNQLKIDVSGWNSGNYIITVFNDNQLIQTGKLVVQ
ncbi:MAG: T9SS type A sorting domain-containing protein [Flavobacteriales bacterium]|nr:T9SS type A sorting domain-containing protein [Flavobacteriales bacterium]